MAHGKDLRKTYSSHLAHHGFGVAMYQPASALDMKPPCCGYIDRNGRWNLVANISTQRNIGTDIFEPLRCNPMKTHEIGINWMPKTSKGIRMWNVDLTGQTPDTGIPVGADGHVKYKSSKAFGAVLIPRNPVELTAYNDETAFTQWLETNKMLLYRKHARELKQYGLWIVTATYTAQECSINAWLDKDKEATVSVKLKAAMLGELGDTVDWTDKLTDKDWSHYAGTQYGKENRKSVGTNIVLFYDGIEVKPYEWWLQGIRSVSRTIFTPKEDLAAYYQAKPEQRLGVSNRLKRYKDLDAQSVLAYERAYRSVSEISSPTRSIKSSNIKDGTSVLRLAAKRSSQTIRAPRASQLAIQQAAH